MMCAKKKTAVAVAMEDVKELEARLTTDAKKQQKIKRAALAENKKLKKQVSVLIKKIGELELTKGTLDDLLEAVGKDRDKMIAKSNEQYTLLHKVEKENGELRKKLLEMKMQRDEALT
jgi:hypothetical protein